ncbi:hypothetical protein [Turicibacter sanguinis]|uniref:hypothetical protein n=1 Tax=Turicibacter sanguinis TaxID=154288 RepID=UPI002942DB50|nr:hypothetical protein [Turicibacter sanguinis]
MNESNKKMVVGLITIFLWITGILFAWTFKNGVCYGDIILQFLKLKSWSNGTSGIHYTVFYSLLFFIPAFMLTNRLIFNLNTNKMDA